MAKRAVMLIAFKDFKDKELFETKQVLEEHGVDVRIASKTKGVATGMDGKTVEVNFDYREILPEDFDAIVFVGGGGASEYFNDDVALGLARDFHNKRKVVAAICIAPSILANAGLLNGREATAFSSESSNLRAKGAIYTNEDVTVDKLIITGKGPHAAKQFGEKIAETLGR